MRHHEHARAIRRSHHEPGRLSHWDRSGSGASSAGIARVHQRV
jgi:hypothetical protein